jgi:hypothetical protein
MRVTRSGVAGLLILLCGQVAAPALTVRVESPAGAPRLVVDGKPVRARMFWGAPAGSPIPVGPVGKQESFEFVAAHDSGGAGTLHFRWGQTPGDIYLDDIRIVDLDTGRDALPTRDFESGPESFTADWAFWPTGAQNTVGTVAVEPGVGRDGSSGLHVKLQAPANGPWPDFHIYSRPSLALTAGHRYRATFWARSAPARALVVALYKPGATYTFLGGPPGKFASQIKLAAGAGVDFVSFPIDFPWPAPGQREDWSVVDAECQAVLDANPKALLLPRFGVDPQEGWRRAHPEDVMVWEDGTSKHTAVVASPRYRKDAAERVTALVKHLEERFGDHMAGYHPCGQNTGEWFYMESWGYLLNGYAPGDTTWFRAWLRERYGTDAALQKAWNNPAVTLDTATAPTAAARHAAPAGVFRDPVTEGPVIDFVEFQQQTMVDCVCELAKAVRQASQGRKLVTFFYGYVFEFGPMGTGPGSSGHYALRQVLDCPDVDLLCSPISYFDRGPGGGAPAMTAAESVALAGKMWLCEDDTATYLSTGDCPGWMERVKTLEETNAQLVRNVAEEALRNFGTWWMDLTATGWFNDPGMWQEMARLKALDEPLLKTPTPFRPEVAAILDERSMMRVASGGQVVTDPGVYKVRAPLGRMGAPYGQYLLGDVVQGKVRAKLNVFLTPWCLSAEQRRALVNQTKGSTNLWCYAPGYLDDGQPSLEAMRELTGFRLAVVSPAQALATPTPLGRQMGLQSAWGVAGPVKPLFAATDARPDEILATFADGSVAVALRRGPSGSSPGSPRHASLFVGAPGLTAELLRMAARLAGVHLFTETDCNVYANGPFIALHASQDGDLVLNADRPGRITDLLSGQALGKGPKVTLAMKRGETRVLRVQER